MKEMILSWKHVFKLDPDKEISDDSLDVVCMSGTDAIMVGGSTGVTYENTVDLLSRVRRYELPCVQEVSDLEAVVPGFDLYMIPMVLNTQDPTWIMGRHREGIECYGYMIPWDLVVTEGYIVLNENAAVAKLTGAETSIEAGTAAAYAQIADKLMNLPIVYLEYSGAFGDMETVRTVRRSLDNARLFYGGGITNAQQALEAASISDTIIVGNVVYDDLEQALETVKAVKG
ncbi:heptaprenylglyceryl phosphate synthase [Paenibacillus glucanolyticus]|uniref:heptaprenylglyceryl phosphate synthase n=1 Tax=Paenibacillus TaxID=44249 RepID=UPI0003E1C4CB|nr:MULTISPECIES: heptaprenylglyceryl phosphate synthase [Paenibacillus]ANA79716.1 geranylgeranylglyceryl/heptaprenylglyceryl phosphate synthase [Paenibacillus glucanolyticus]AVV56261.1 heptaprenylglyceryl phosphate synthase [Paenibacillus glucanolyticus]ETT34067.1 geranylgeranylglyceryl phosphate synthase family protein [Paenibacillus sp. FSL R5-808]MPY20139.1 heptaprenylglyceryl phosphate synthase [Paenibacillus glucanolyticus]